MHIWGIYMQIQCPQNLEDGVRFSGTEATGGWESPETLVLGIKVLTSGKSVLTFNH